MLGLKISPLPWHTKHDGDPVQIADAGGKFVGMTLPSGSDGAMQLDYNNALMIAHAVSHYDAVREALAYLIEFVATCDVEHPAFRDAKLVLDKARDAEDETRRLSRIGR